MGRFSYLVKKWGWARRQR